MARSTQGHTVGRRIIPVCAALTALLVVGCTSSPPTSSTPSGPVSPQPPNGKPNVVFILTDDLSSNLVQYMPNVQQLQRNGVNFSDYFVTDSLCCPSRTSIFTGQYPHDDGVFTNGGNDGGFAAFQRNGDEARSFGPELQRAGYTTGFMGKYLNGYLPTDAQGTNKPYVPPGWNEWDVAGNGYPEFNYDLNENGAVHHYGNNPQDYLTDVLSGKATSYIDGAAAAHTPFALEVATFAPHKPSTPAPRDANAFPGITAPRTAAYDKQPTNAPTWLSAISPLTNKNSSDIDQEFAKRVRSVQAVDAMIGHLEQELQAKGLAENTYFVFSSDNGYHMGEYRLRPGKQTAFDTDIRVPLVVTGPGVPKGQQLPQLAENIDLNPTFTELVGGTPAPTADGRSLVPLLHGQPVDGWRQAVLIEHHNPGKQANDPDAAPKASGNPPSYEAIRTADALYVAYSDGEREYYDLKTDPDELNNLAASAPAQVRSTLTALQNCHGGSGCWAAAQLRP